MLPEIRIDSFDGPTLLELAPVIDEIPDPIEARWAGTPAEFLFLAKVTNRSLILYVQDFHAQDRITLHLGAPIVFEKGLIERGRQSLTAQKPQVPWREFCEALGHTRSSLLLTKLVADSIRAGRKPITSGIAVATILEGVNPADADILLRLKAGAPKHP